MPDARGLLEIEEDRPLPDLVSEALERPREGGDMRSDFGIDRRIAETRDIEHAQLLVSPWRGAGVERPAVALVGTREDRVEQHRVLDRARQRARGLEIGEYRRKSVDARPCGRSTA